jgi:hypothetical protein
MRRRCKRRLKINGAIFASLQMNGSEHKFLEPAPRRDCFVGMGSFFDKARDWRRRAEELRCTAERMVTPAARNSLLDRAASLEHHAANLEQITVKFRHIHEAAADTRPLDAYIWRPRMPIPQEGDCRTASS